MEAIIDNLHNPSWWFTGIFFIIFSVALSKLFKVIPRTLKTLSRKSRARSLKKIKKIRQHTHDIQYQISVENSYFMGFIITGFLYLILFISSPLIEIVKQSFSFGMLLTIPLYIIEVIWLNKKEFVNDLLKSTRKLKKK